MLLILLILCIALYRGFSYNHYNNHYITTGLKHTSFY
jgi:hypothetical protein